MRYLLLAILLAGCCDCTRLGNSLERTERHWQRIAEELETYNQNWDARTKFTVKTDTVYMPGPKFEIYRINRSDTTWIKVSDIPTYPLPTTFIPTR